ncbi:molybdopterin synthase catalytic subunit 1 isoform X2 [Acyrthosiphon pisum]|uniref:Uncharacterized protein n=1 Tax=Acyrthosiphon pisum TaxID=7029 RepID=A0A8R2JME7_ACYPI|nr:molybdopterin synthase catalytic subunit 1 isoform X2 [Acyrthosiphon pisum]
MTIIIGHFLRNTKEALRNLLFNMVNILTSRSLVFQMINRQILNKKSFCFLKIPIESLKLFIKVCVTYCLSLRHSLTIIDNCISKFRSDLWIELKSGNYEYNSVDSEARMPTPKMSSQMRQQTLMKM